MAKKQKKITNNGFRLKFGNSKVIKGIVESLSNIIDEANIIVNSKELSIKAMDPSRICLLQLVIKKADFDEYECNGEYHVGLNLDDFDKILKRSGSTDTIELNYIEEEKKVKIKYQREGAKRIRIFSLSCLDVDVEDVPMDSLLKIDYPSSWSFDPDLFIEAIKDAEIYSEILVMKATEDIGLELSSYGQIGEMDYQLDLEDFIEIDLEKEQTGSFSLVFLKNIMKLASITETLKIFLKEGHPLKMIFNILEGAELQYFLAPRVDEKENYDEFEDAEFEEVEEEIPEDTEDSEDTEDELLEEVE